MPSSPVPFYIVGYRVERTASKRWRGSVRRVVSASVLNLSCFSHGCSTGWVSGVLGPEALAGGAWLAALPCLVAVPAGPFFGVLANAKGRKAGAFWICLSFIISFSLTAWGGPRGLWVARVAAGAGCAGALCLAPLYCSEIAPRTKKLAAMPALASSCGVLFVFAAGGVLSAHSLSLVLVAPPLLLLLSLAWLPETPAFLISVGRMQDAAKVICWLDGSDFREDLTDAIEQQEVMIRTEPARRGSAQQPMLKRSRSEGTSEGRGESVLRELFRHRRSRRALFSCCILLTAAAGSGAGVVNSFAIAMLSHSSHSLPALNATAFNMTIYNGSMPRGWHEASETGSVLCSVALVLGAATATLTVDRFGRKTLLLISCLGIAFCLTILAIYCDPHLHMYSWYTYRLWPFKKNITKDKNTNYNTSSILVNTTRDISMKNSTNDTMMSFNKKTVYNGSVGEEYARVEEELAEAGDGSIWLPVALLSTVVFLYNVGLGSVPYVLISELFSLHVRSFASGLLISWMWFTNFISLRYFGSLASVAGLYAAYYVGASILVLVSSYVYLTIPETKDKNPKQIEDLLDGPLLIHMKRKRKVDDES